MPVNFIDITGFSIGTHEIFYAADLPENLLCHLSPLFLFTDNCQVYHGAKEGLAYFIDDQVGF